MRIFKRPLLSRIKSLEEYFGVFYDADGNWQEHQDAKYSELERIKERLGKLETKVFPVKDRK